MGAFKKFIFGENDKILDTARHYFHDHSVGICSSWQKCEGFITGNCFQRDYQKLTQCGVV